MIAGVASAIIFAKEVAMQEMVWYVEPDKRKCGLKLLREFEQRAKARKLDFILMPTVFQRSERFYKRLGYRAYQNTFLKRMA